jgi:hypothetical protein
MLAVLLRFTLSFVYKVYICFLSRVRDWTSAVEHSTVNLLVQYFKIWLYNNLDMFTFRVFSRELTNQVVSRNRSSANRCWKSRKCIVKQIF